MIVHPIHFLPIGVFLSISLILFYLGIKTYQNFKINNLVRVLYFCIGLTILGSSSLVAALERLFFITYLHPTIIVSMEIIQSTLNSFGYIFLNLFCINIISEKYDKKMFFIYLAFALLDLIVIILIPPIPSYTTFQVTLQEIVIISQFICAIPIVLAIPALLFYYSYSMRHKSPPHSKVSFLLGTAIIFIFIILYIKMFLPAEFADILRLLWIPAFIYSYIIFIRFVEIEWPKKIRHIFLVMEKNGTCLYDHSFTKIESVERDLFGSSMSGITEILRELTRSQHKLQFLDQGDVKILLTYGNYIVGILVTEADFVVLRKKMNKLVQEFENQYEKALKKFTGSLNEFESARSLIIDLFTHKGFLDRAIFR